ncbi:MAG: type I restriction enzyme HsdR N-terminal domain-containing protein [Prevotellaceae bacterium]|jgi:type I restriction enzyme M protein|nr:type I restriction enzyme HsdR N-terminal domain-containing protein [Prevotellaceae bacterium]
MTLSEIIKDSGYRHAQFDLVQIHEFEQRIIVKNDSKGKEIPYIKCLIRGKEIRLTPEETVRQLYLEILLNDYKYPADRIELEYNVTFGREKKRADIVIFDRDQTTTPYIIVELKKPRLKDGKEQLKSYCNATGAPIGVWTNGDSISFYHRRDPN